jgi:hypothetical protein
VLDTVPSARTPDTLFVPYFWPDEPDVGVNGFPYPNNYLPERQPPLAGYQYDGPTPDKDDGRGTFLLKYDGTTRANIEDKPPSPAGRTPPARTRSCAHRQPGPRAGQHRQALPLGGRRHPVVGGLMWGWRALSPEAPFTEGAAYGASEKHIVIFTDGFNAAAEQEYWGFAAPTTRLRLHEGERGAPRLKGRTATYQALQELPRRPDGGGLHEHQGQGHHHHAVTFKVSDPATETLFKNCVSDPKALLLRRRERDGPQEVLRPDRPAHPGREVYLSR